MKKQHSLTNEQLANQFTSLFDLVNYAISLAKDIVTKEQAEEVNPANKVIDIINERQKK